MDDLGNAFDEVMRRKRPLQSLVATVLEIDKNTCECVVNLVNIDADVHGVNLRASIQENNKNGVVFFPVVGSTVIVSLNSNNELAADYFVSMYSEINEISFYSGGKEVFTISDQGVSFFGGENGGLVVAEKLAKEIKKNTEAIEKLVNLVKDFAPKPNDGGASLKAEANLKFTSVNLADLSSIENEKFKH